MKVRLPSFYLKLASLRPLHAMQRRCAGKGSDDAGGSRLPARAVRPVVIPEFKQWMALPLLKESLPANQTPPQTKPLHQKP